MRIIDRKGRDAQWRRARYGVRAMRAMTTMITMITIIALLGVSGCAARAPRHPAGAAAVDPAASTAAAGVVAGVVDARGAPTPSPNVEVLREGWQFAAYSGFAMTTPHYRIYTTIEDERILGRLPIFLEHAFARYTTALGNLPLSRRRMDTYVFRDRRQWKAKTRQLLPEQASTFENLGRGGFTTRGISVLYYIDWYGRDRDTFAIAAHEGWHQYTQSTFKNPLPIWLEEGIATYMEGYRFRPNAGGPSFLPARNWERRSALRDAVRYDRLIPLAELLRESPQSFLGDGKDRLLTYYAQVWALTRFLAAADGEYRDALENALRDAADGALVRKTMRSPAVIARGGRSRSIGNRTGPWLILAYFTSDLSQFETQYIEYMHRIAEE